MPPPTPPRSEVGQGEFPSPPPPPRVFKGVFPPVSWPERRPPFSVSVRRKKNQKLPSSNLGSEKKEVHTRRRKVGRVGGATARERESKRGRERERSNELHVERLGETLGRQLCPAALFFFMCLSLEEERGESADGRGERRSRCVCEGGRTRVPHYDAAPAWEFFFTASGNPGRVSVWLRNPSPLVFFRLRSKQLPPSPPQDTSPCSHLRPPPSAPQVHGFKNSEESPPRTVTWLTCRFSEKQLFPPPVEDAPDKGSRVGKRDYRY